MFGFFKRTKSKDSSGSERNDKDKTKQSSTGSSFFNKKSDAKRRNSDCNGSKGGRSTSESVAAKANGIVPRNIDELKSLTGVDNKTIIGAVSNCDNRNKLTNNNSDNKMGNAEDKPVRPDTQPDIVDAENKRETVEETTPPQTVLATSDKPTASPTNKTTGENNGDPVSKLRANFFNSDVNKKIDGINRNDLKKSSCDVSGVSESATAKATSAQEIESSDCQQPAKKEGTPDSDAVFKTAPNTPVLSRLPAVTTNVIELPSITEDGNSTKLYDSDTNTNNCKKLIESSENSVCDKLEIPDGDRQKQIESPDYVSKILTESVEKINDKILINDPKSAPSNLSNTQGINLQDIDSKLLESSIGKSNTIPMAESAECPADVDVDTQNHKEVVPFADSDADDEDNSQGTSKSETTCSNSVPHDKSSSCSEKDNRINNGLSIEEIDSNKNFLNDCPKGDVDGQEGNTILNSVNDNNKNEILDLNENKSKNIDESQCLESSKETEDEASDSEMEENEENRGQQIFNKERCKTEIQTDKVIKIEGEEIVNVVVVDDSVGTEDEPNNEHPKSHPGDKSQGTSHNEIIENKAETASEIDKNLENETENNTEEEDEPEEEIQEDENGSQQNEDSSNNRRPSDLEIKENLVNIESKADHQISELKTELKQSEKEINNLKIQVGDLQREVIVKSSGMERVQAELTAAYKESECVRKKLKKLEEDLDIFKQKNSDLTDELDRKTENESENDYWRIIELENEVKEQTQRVKDLESQITAIRLERDKLAKALEEMTAEREEEKKLVQETLDEALAEKISIQEKFEREFEKLRSVNCDREQKMFDDFEWKLREVESACKKRLDEKEQSSKQLIREIEGKLTIAEGKLAQLPHLKQCEQELNQLREKSIEQTRALRAANRQAEQLQNSEKLLQDEIKHLKSLLEKEKSHLTTVQGIHIREIQEKERKFQFRLDQQKNDLNKEWEEKLKRDSQKIKTELERILRNEKQLALEEAKQQHEHKLRQLKSTWEKKHEDTAKEIDQLKQKLAKKEEEFKRELETVQTASDQDIFVLRRKLDKIDISYQEKIEKMQEKHEKEIERITMESDRKLQQCELNWQAQVGSSRTTIELVKEQMHREAQEQLQELSERHRKQLEEQWDQLIQERDETIALMEQKHRASMEKLRLELDSIYKIRNSRESELMDSLNHLRQELSGKTNTIDDLKSNVDQLHENLEVLSTEVNDKTSELTKTKQTTDEKISGSSVTTTATVTVLLLPFLSWFFLTSFPFTFFSLLFGIVLMLLASVS